KGTLRLIPQHFYALVKAWAPVAQTGHRAILAAFEANDPEAARLAAVSHVTEAGELMITQFTDSGYWMLPNRKCLLCITARPTASPPIHRSTDATCVTPLPETSQGPYSPWRHPLRFHVKEATGTAPLLRRHSDPRRRLRQLLAGPDPVLGPGCYD